MIIGEIIAITGTVFLTRLDINTLTVKWVTYLVIAGFGMGMAVQAPYSAL